MVLSPDALLVRLSDLDPWTILCWRGLFFGLSMMVVARFMDGRVPSLNWAHVQLGVISAVGNIAFVFALMTTTVANTLVVLSTSPLLGAVLSAIFLKEKVGRHTWAAAAFVTAAIGAVAWSSYSAGNVWGDVFAMISALGMAATFVFMRAKPKQNMVPALGLGGLFSSVAAVAFATPFAVGVESIGWLLLLGCVVLPVAFTLLAIAPKHAPAPDVGLVMLLEAVLGPIWVYLVFGELPARVVFYAGGAILFTLAIWTLIGLRPSKSLLRE